MSNNYTYVLKIDLDKINNINTQNSIKIFGDQYRQNGEIVFMSKKEYRKYVFNNSGNIIDNYSINPNYNSNCDDDICLICHKQIKNTKIFKLNKCNHQFHYKCIKKWFKILSKQKNESQCPLCRASKEELIFG